MQYIRVAAPLVQAGRAHLPNRIITDFMAVPLAEMAKKCGWGLYDATV